MKTQILAAVLMAWAPLNSSGASASNRAYSTRLAGRESERRARSMAVSAFGYGIEALRAPHQDGHHQRDVGGECQLGREIAGVVGHLRDQEGAEKAAADRAQAT